MDEIIPWNEWVSLNPIAPEGSEAVLPGVQRLEEKRESSVRNVRLCQFVRPCNRREKAFHNLM